MKECDRIRLNYGRHIYISNHIEGKEQRKSIPISHVEGKRKERQKQFRQLVFGKDTNVNVMERY